ncbi:MAG: exodeoxyribonuclease VII small subunit [Rikenellaceae bacterium]|nr:exodeoxyribonuclease VII small subunit [Rikenellaceae bacterium]
MEKEEKTYGEAIAEIEAILEKFDDEQFDIDTLAGQVKRATELIRICRQKLRKAEEEVSKVLKDSK